MYRQLRVKHHHIVRAMGVKHQHIGQSLGIKDGNHMKSSMQHSNKEGVQVRDIDRQSIPLGLRR